MTARTAGSLAPEGAGALTTPDPVDCFTALYQQTRPRVYAYAVSLAGRQLAEEIVSEVFLVAWRRLADLPGHGGPSGLGGADGAESVLPWLLAVARNVAAGQFRAAVRQQSIAAELRAWTSPAELQAGDIADDITERLAVLTALTVLSAADRELLTLVAWHGLAPAEAARVVGCSTAAYFVRLHRAPVTRFVLRSEHGRVSRLAVVPLGPRLALAAGAVDSYNAVLSAGWTSATPRLPAPSRRFSVTTDGKG